MATTYFNVARARQDGLSDDQIRQMIAQSGAQPDINLDQPTQTTQGGDLASNIGSGLINMLTTPFVKTGQGLAEGGQNALSTLKLLFNKGSQEDYNKIVNQDAFGKSNTELAKGEAGIASFFVPFGKGASIASKALIPGAIAGGLQGASEDNATPQSVIGNAALGAGGAGLLHGLLGLGGKAAGAIGQGADNVANKVAASQYNVLPKDKEALQLGNTVKTLADQYGLRNINDVTNAAKQVTGDNGILTQAVRNAVSKSSPIDVGGILDASRNLIGNEPLISDSTGNKFNDIVTKGIQSMVTDSPTGGDPGKAFDFIRQLESKATTLKHGNDEAQALSRVYKGVANELTDRLFAGTDATGRAIPGAGADNALVNNPLSQDQLSALNNISPKLAQQAAGAKTIGELRSLQAPFVRASQLAQKTADRTNNQLIGGKDIGAGIVGAILSGGNPLTTGGVVAAEKAINSSGGKSLLSELLSQTGKASKIASNQTNNDLINQIIGITGSKLPGAIQSSTNIINPSSNAGYNQGQISQGEYGTNNNGNYQQDSSNNNGGSYQKSNIQFSPQQSYSNNTQIISPPNAQVNSTSNARVITPDIVEKAMLTLPPAAAAKVQQLYEIQQEGLKNQAALNTPTDPKTAAAAQVGNAALQRIYDKLSKDPRSLNLLLVPGQPGVRQLQSDMSSLIDAIGYMRTGAAVDKNQRKDYEKILPQPGDSPDTIRYKLANIQQELATRSRLAYPQYGQ